MATVQVKYTSTSKVFRAWLDGVRVTFHNGVAEKDLAAGKHRLSWAARGAPGTTYKIAVTKPKEAHCGHEATLDEDMIDFGFCWFRLS